LSIFYSDILTCGLQSWEWAKDWYLWYKSQRWDFCLDVTALMHRNKVHNCEICIDLNVEPLPQMEKS